MKRSKAIGFAAAVVFAGLWAIPMVRAVLFFRWAQNYFHETSSINASNDLRLSLRLLGCYLLSLLAAFVFAWFLSRRPRFWLFFPAALLAYAACEVLWLRPETTIHLFPTMTPWRPVYISALAVGIAVVLIYFSRTDRYDKNA